MTNEKLSAYLLLAKSAALAAGKVIMNLINSEFTVNKKGENLSFAASVVTAVDVAAQDIILSYLNPTICADIGLLSEELSDDNSRLNKSFFWCVDPLDGTLAFTQKQHGFAVSIALMNNLGETLLGVVYDPYKRDMYSAMKNRGFFINDIPFKIPVRSNTFTLVTDASALKSNNWEEVERTVRADYTSNNEAIAVLECGGACMNAIYVIKNPPAVYLKPVKKQIGGGAIWDFACATLFFSELKLSFLNYKNKPLILNSKHSVYLNDQGVRFLNI